MLYFAYGSNLLTERLAARCPSARPLGRAVLRGFRVGFAKYSFIDGSGKATILPTPDAAAQGVVFEVAAAEMADLDRIEGLGNGYDRITVTLSGAAAEAVAYVASDPSEPLRPFDWYLALILAGARQHGLGAEAVAALAAAGYDSDPEPDRPGRRAALEALARAGHADWRRLLGTN